MSIKEGKRRPARVQLDPSLVHENGKPDQTGQAFNIWYSKWTGGENNGRVGLVHAKHLCNVAKDSGYTKADRYLEEGQINRSHYFCLYFARGYCCNGKNCEFLHRTPSELDIFPPTVDCFGREKFMDYRDDMSGIGSFGRVNKTLYVGRINDTSKGIEERLTKRFSEFGDIKYVKALKDSNAAFVSYKLESQAQFAKEAMYCQSIVPGNENETLNIRWANEDPSFLSKKRKYEEEEEMSMEAARKLLAQLQSQNMNKKQKISISESKNDRRDVKTETAPVEERERGIDMDLLDELFRLRKSQPQMPISEGLISGYSSSDDNE